MTFVEQIIENAKNKPDEYILADDTNPKGITCSQLDDLSGRVYAYLKGKGVGKEDFVMICLPRGIKPLISLLGILKNGSAFVIVEDDYAPERIEFIKKDCGCKFVIDTNVWDEIQATDSKSGYEKTEEHDAAFAVYTSGTTGNPKGVIHEYGNLDRMVKSVTIEKEPLAVTGNRFALVAPLNFVASMLILTYGFYYTVFIYVVSYKTLKNPLLLGMFIKMNGIDGTFLTPSHIRRLGDKLLGLGLKFCIIGSEPAREVYVDGFKIHNFYLMSESGFAVSHFLVDKLYTDTPVGKSEFGHNIMLIGDDGNEVKDGEKGEICFENKYVRGYVNLPEETNKVFKDGIYHTGDLAYKDTNGNLVMCGRLNDMVKVNGNRVEPGEIENVAKQVLNVDWAAARIFDENGKVFIALYYTADINVDTVRTQREMSLYIPYYMIPSFFIHIDSVPLRPNGKMDRKALPAPDFSKYKKEYIAPKDDIEKALCAAFEKALGIDKIGVNDDFYELGGDSLASMDVITNSGLNGLTTTHIFKGRTVSKIAELYKEDNMAFDGVDISEYNKKCMSKPQRLSDEQVYMVDYQLYSPRSTMYNLYQMIKLDKSIIDLEKIADCVKKAIFNHPALLTTFYFDQDGDMMQKYNPEVYRDIKVEKITEEKFNMIKDLLVEPFRMVDSRLYRCRIFETENAGYLFLDVHHTIFDGTSGKVFFGDVLKYYFGEEVEPDYYYVNLRKRHKEKESKNYKEAKDYFDEKYGAKNWQKSPTADYYTRDNDSAEMFCPLDFDSAAFKKLTTINMITPNVFYIVANLIALGTYNRNKDVMVSWIYNGRSNANELNTVGLLFRNLPVACTLSKDMKILDLYKDVTEQVNKGIEHSCYPYVEMSKQVIIDDIECVLYQDDLREIADMPGILGEVEIKHNRLASQNVLDLEILNTKEGTKVMIDYNSSRYIAKSIDDYSKIMKTVIEILVKEVKNEEMTVSDVICEVYKTFKIGNIFSRFFMLGWLR